MILIYQHEATRQRRIKSKLILFAVMVKITGNVLDVAGLEEG